MQPVHHRQQHVPPLKGAFLVSCAPDSSLPPAVVLGLTLSDNKKHTSHKPSGVGTDQRNHRGSTHAPSRSSATALHELLHRLLPLLGRSAPRWFAHCVQSILRLS